MRCLPFLAESFGRWCSRTVTLDRSVVEEVDPDIVITVMNERFLIRVPDDAGAKTLEECAAEKRATGAVWQFMQSKRGGGGGGGGCVYLNKHVHAVKKKTDLHIWGKSLAPKSLKHYMGSAETIRLTHTDL